MSQLSSRCMTTVRTIGRVNTLAPDDPNRTGGGVDSVARPGGPSISRRALIAGGAAALAGGAAWAVLSRDEPAADGPLPLYQRARFGAYADNAPYPDLGPFFGL